MLTTTATKNRQKAPSLASDKSDGLPLNAFLSVRPRGTGPAAPAKQPRKTNTSRAPAQGNVAMDSNGRRTVDLAPRNSGIHIESATASAASVAKRQRISKGAAI